MKRFAFAAWLMLAISCDEASFQSGQGAGKPAPTPSLAPPSETPGSANATVQTERFSGSQTEKYEVDIFFLLDTSGSMDDKIQRTLSNLQFLIDTFLQSNQKFDFKIFLVGEVSPSSADPRVSVIPNKIGSHNALIVAQSILSGTSYGMRENSVKELVVVSDDDSELSASSFLSWVSASKSRLKAVHVNSIVASVQECGGGIFGIGNGAVGSTYVQLSQNPETQGAVANICDSNWQGIFQTLGSKLKEEKLASEITITLGRPVTAPSSIQVLFNGSPLGPAEFSYDGSRNQVRIVRPSQPSDTIDVQYL